MLIPVVRIAQYSHQNQSTQCRLVRSLGATLIVNVQ